MRKTFFILLCFACRMAEGAETGRAVLIGTNVVSLGTYPSTENRTVHVKIRNGGTGELKIEGVVLTCDCLRIDGYPPSIGVGLTGEVAVTIKKSEIAGAFRRVFHVRTDDPAKRLITMTVEGIATPPGFRIVPDQITLQASETTAKRRFLIAVDETLSSDITGLSWRFPLEGTDVCPRLSKSGHGFLVEVAFSAAAIERLKKNGPSVLTFKYHNGAEVPIPVCCE